MANIAAVASKFREVIGAGWAMGASSAGGRTEEALESTDGEIKGRPK